MAATGRQTPSVLVVGESIMDIVRIGDDESRHPGGSPMNVAYGLGRLGIETRLLTRLGRDADGDAIRDHLASGGVSVLAESGSDGKTSSAIATVQPDGSAGYSFDVAWNLGGFAGVQLAKWIHVGSIATFLSPGADSIEQLLQAVWSRIPVSYDPNIRPSLIGEHQQALSRFERIARLAKVVKLSDEDAEWLYPEFAEDFVIDRILSFGTQIVALTRGSRGARISSQRYSVDVAAPHVEVTDTIGAGDSFMAALIAELCTLAITNVTSKRLERAAWRSVTAAAVACTRPGAQPPSWKELKAALRVQSRSDRRP